MGNFVWGEANFPGFQAVLFAQKITQESASRAKQGCGHARRVISITGSSLDAPRTEDGGNQGKGKVRRSISIQPPANRSRRASSRPRAYRHRLGAREWSRKLKWIESKNSTCACALAFDGIASLIARGHSWAWAQTCFGHCPIQKRFYALDCFSGSGSLVWRNSGVSMT